MGKLNSSTVFVCCPWFLNEAEGIFLCSIELAKWQKPGDMNTLNEIKQAVRQLSPEELVAFRAWLTEFDSATWDQKLKEAMTRPDLVQTLKILQEIADRINVLEQKALTELLEKQSIDNIDLASQGINKAQAQILRSSLATFADDWDDPEMSIYDDYDTAKAHVEAG